MDESVQHLTDSIAAIDKALVQSNQSTDAMVSILNSLQWQFDELERYMRPMQQTVNKLTTVQSNIDSALDELEIIQGNLNVYGEVYDIVMNPSPLRYVLGDGLEVKERFDGYLRSTVRLSEGLLFLTGSDGWQDTDVTDSSVSKLGHLKEFAMESLLSEYGRRLELYMPTVSTYMVRSSDTTEKVSEDIQETMHRIANCVIKCGCRDHLEILYRGNRSKVMMAVINRCADLFFPSSREVEYTVSSTFQKSIHRNSVVAASKGHQQYDRSKHGIITLFGIVKDMILSENRVSMMVLPPGDSNRVCFLQSMAEPVYLLSTISLEKAHKNVRAKYSDTEIVFIFADVVDWLNQELPDLVPVLSHQTSNGTLDQIGRSRRQSLLASALEALHSHHLQERKLSMSDANTDPNFAFQQFEYLAHQWIHAAQMQLQCVGVELAKDNSKVQKNGMVHHISSKTLNYIRRLNNSKDTIAPLCAQYLDNSPNSYDSIEQATNEAFCRYITEILRILDSKIEQKAKSLKPTLAAIFRVNHYDYVLHGITNDSSLSNSFGTSLIRKRQEQLTKVKEEYLKVTTGPVVPLLTKEPPRVEYDDNGTLTTASRNAIKDFFHGINKWIQDQHGVQGKFSVPNPDMRTELRMQIRSIVVPEYEVLFAQLRGVPFSKHKAEKYLTHPPGLVSTMISQFFEDSEHLVTSMFRKFSLPMGKFPRRKSTISGVRGSIMGRKRTNTTPNATGNFGLSTHGETASVASHVSLSDLDAV